MLPAESVIGKTLLEAALAYAGLGWQVIPLNNLDEAGNCSCGRATCGRSAAKHPRTANWNGAKTDKPKGHSSAPAIISKWWGQWPEANVGILAGSESGIFDLECEEEGLADLAALQEANGAFPPTPQAQSGHGGLHHIFRWPAGAGLAVTTGSHLDKKPIDTRGRDGQFVAPPSRNTGGVYRWVVSPLDVAPAEAPEWLFAWLKENGRLEDKAHAGNGTSNGKAPPYRVKHPGPLSVEDRAILYLSRSPAAISGQGGHAQTFAVARAIVYGFDLGADLGFELIRDHYNPRCVPEWAERDLRHKCADADSRPCNKARGYLLADGAERPRCGSGPAPSTNRAAAPPPIPPGQDGTTIIRDFFVERYRPDFKRGNLIHTQDGREIAVHEACAVPTSALIERLTAATNAPQFKGGGVNRDALPSFFSKWAKPAWGDMLEQLPDEDAAELAGDAEAPEEFRRLVREAMFTEVILGDVIGKGGVTQTERRSLIEWCYRFAKPGPWRAIRSKRCWCKIREKPGGELVLMVAIRHELFAQLKADRRLCNMGATKFTRRAGRYKVGASTVDDRPHGLSAVVLADEFVACMVATLPDEADEAPER